MTCLTSGTVNSAGFGHVTQQRHIPVRQRTSYQSIGQPVEQAPHEGIGRVAFRDHSAPALAPGGEWGNHPIFEAVYAQLPQTAKPHGPSPAPR